MSRDTFILIAFCVFMLLVGMRLKQRFSKWKDAKTTERVNKNQRPKMAAAEEPPVVKAARERREKRVRFFTIAQMVLLFLLMIYMIPALVRDISLIGSVDISNLILRCLIFVCTIYIFILGYIKVFGKKKKEETE